MRNLFIFLLIFLSLVSVSNALVNDCNKQCLITGYASGACRTSCDPYESYIGDVADCTAVGTLSLIIGTGSIQSYFDKDPYISQDKDNPDWIWMLKDLDLNKQTDVTNTTDDTQHSGPIVAVKNKFDATSLATGTGLKSAITVGSSYCLPGGNICIKYDSDTVSSYSSYQIKYTTADFSSIFPSGWSAKPTILIDSLDYTEGLLTQRANYDLPNITTDVKTDKIWIAYNTSNYLAIFYEDGSNNKQLAGHVLMNEASDNTNIADINYLTTKDTNIQINIKGSSGTADNLDILLDILGDSGLPATNGYDDVTISLSHAASGNFDGIGVTPGTAESSEITWRSSEIGAKTGNLMNLYGVQILAPFTYGASDTVSLEIPGDQQKANILITNTHTSSQNTTTVTTSTPEKQQPAIPVISSEVSNLRDYNLILVGGPCANPLVPAVFGMQCTDWNFTRGESIIQLTRNGENYALLVAGTTLEDTQEALDVLIKQKLQGSSVKIKRNKVEVMEKVQGVLNLSKYPYPFILSNNYNKLKIVYGDSANIQDSFGAVKLGKALANLTGSTVVTYTNQTISETVSDVDKEEIPLGSSLGSESFFGPYFTPTPVFKNRFKGVTYTVHDEVMFYGDGPSLETSLSSSDDAYGATSYLELKPGNLRYYYVFDDAIQLSTSTPDASITIKFLENALTITDVEKNRILVEEGKEYILDVGDNITVNNKKVVLEGVTSTTVVLDINGEKEIIDHGIRRKVQGLWIKPIAGFTNAPAACCCFDVLSYFR